MFPASAQPCRIWMSGREEHFLYLPLRGAGAYPPTSKLRANYCHINQWCLEGEYFMISSDALLMRKFFHTSKTLGWSRKVKDFLRFLSIKAFVAPSLNHTALFSDGLKFQYEGKNQDRVAVIYGGFLDEGSCGCFRSIFSDLDKVFLSAKSMKFC